MHDYFHHEETTYMCILFSVSLLPIYAAEAGGEFGSGGFMMQYTGTTDAVTGTVFFCAGTINTLGRLGLPDRLPFSKTKVNWLLHMWTGHGSYIPFLHDLRAKVQLFLHICNFFCIFVAKKMIYGYIRVSSDKQTVENQRFEIERFCKVNNLHIDGWIEETISGTKAYNKRQLGVLLKKVEKEDVIICSELSRLGRSLFMIMEILSICMKKECRVLDNLSCKGNLCDYVDRAWHIFSAIWFMATHSARVTWRLEGSYSHGERMSTRPAATESNKPSLGL